jgi:HSP20 family protein
MALIRWEPVRELQTMQNEMNRLFNTFFDSPSGTGGNGANTPLRRWIPAMDVVETGDHFVLRADLPGMSENNVNIELEDNVLTISGERKSEHEQRNEGYYRVERASGSFSRSLTLPEGVDPEGIQASFENGVLEVRIPKPEQQKPRKVQISLGGSAKTIEGAETAEPTPAGAAS